MSKSGDSEKDLIVLRAALSSEEQFFELLRQEADTEDYRSLRKTVEEGCHPSHEILYDYVLDWLDEKTRGALMEHISLCGVCAGEVLRIRSIENEVEEGIFNRIGGQTDSTSEHLSGQVFREILKGGFNELDLKHLTSCEHCRKRLQDLEESMRYPAKQAGYVNFSEVGTFFSGNLKRLSKAFKSTIEIFGLMPAQVIVSADSGAQQSVQQCKALIEDVAGNRLGATDILIGDPPRIGRGVFTTEIEVMDARYWGCRVTVGIHLRSEEIVLTTEDTIPSDGLVYIREEVGVEGDFNIHPHMLVVTIHLPPGGLPVRGA
jgi:hypothetical protein